MAEQNKADRVAEVFISVLNKLESDRDEFERKQLVDIDKLNRLMAWASKEAGMGHLVRMYLSVRNNKKIHSKRFKLFEDFLNTLMQSVDARFLSEAAENQINSSNTPHGTIYRQVKTQVRVTDWDKFYAYVMKNKRPDLLQKRIAQNSAKEIINGNEDVDPEDIPGTTLHQEFTVGVRKG